MTKRRKSLNFQRKERTKEYATAYFNFNGTNSENIIH
jgi:hypothetical protein